MPTKENPGDQAQDSLSESESVYAQTSAVSDQTANSDTLGFKLYVDAIANFLLAPATRAPFTLSIEGSWGSGKSSFMLQLKERMKVQSPNSTAVDFNAWKYEKQEELWAAFALTIARSLREKTPFLRRILGKVRLYCYRLNGPEKAIKFTGKILILLLLVGAFAGSVYWSLRSNSADRVQRVEQLTREFLPELKSSEEGASHQHNSSFVIANSHWITGLILVIGAIRKIPMSFHKNLFEFELEKYIDKPDYNGKAAFIDAFSDDFGKIIKAYAPKRKAKIFVFIDDLDRCDVPQAAEIMRAINMMIGDNNQLYFIIGLDRDKVAASIAYKFRNIAPFLFQQSESTQPADGTKEPDYGRLRAFGDEYLEKFIQLSFRIPVSDGEQQTTEFINSLVSAPVEELPKPNLLHRLFPRLKMKDLQKPQNVTSQQISNPDRDPFRVESGPESERIRQVLFLVREVFGYNPRRIKQFLNRYRLSLYIASSQGLFDKDLKTGKAEITPEQLGKFVALTSCYPEILAESLKNAALFKDIEIYLTYGESERNDYLEAWLDKPGVRGLLTPPSDLTTVWQNTFSLGNFPVSKFVRILPPVPASPKQPRPENLEVQYEQDSGFGDTTSNSGYAEVQEDAMHANYGAADAASSSIEADRERLRAV
ncbi:MAG: P-loop NTPase fold protein [Terracidiphilus sp.]